MKKLVTTGAIAALSISVLAVGIPSAAQAVPAKQSSPATCFENVVIGTELTWNEETYTETSPFVPGTPESYAALGDYTSTRATGHYEAGPTGLRIWTEGSTWTDKVAGYLPVSIPLSTAASSGATLDFANTSGGMVPGAQLVVDISGDGLGDGILVGEPGYYGANWWLNSAATDAFKALDPSGADNGGNGSAWFGTLAEWADAAPTANVVAVGFSLGSGAKGDGLVTGFTTAGTTYSFVEYTPATPDVAATYEWVVTGSGQSAQLPVSSDTVRYVQTGTENITEKQPAPCDGPGKGRGQGKGK